jgi:hypothetical protein
LIRRHCRQFMFNATTCRTIVFWARCVEGSEATETIRRQTPIKICTRKWEPSVSFPPGREGSV